MSSSLSPLLHAYPCLDPSSTVTLLDICSPYLQRKPARERRQTDVPERRAKVVTSGAKSGVPSPLEQSQGGRPLMEPCHSLTRTIPGDQRRRWNREDEESLTNFPFCRFWSRFPATFLATCGRYRPVRGYRHEFLASFLKSKPCPTSVEAGTCRNLATVCRRRR